MENVVNVRSGMEGFAALMRQHPDAKVFMFNSHKGTAGKVEADVSDWFDRFDLLPEGFDRLSHSRFGGDFDPFCSKEELAEWLVDLYDLLNDDEDKAEQDASAKFEELLPYWGKAILVYVEG